MGSVSESSDDQGGVGREEQVDEDSCGNEREEHTERLLEVELREEEGENKRDHTKERHEDGHSGIPIWVREGSFSTFRHVNNVPFFPRKGALPDYPKFFLPSATRFCIYTTTTLPYSN